VRTREVAIPNCGAGKTAVLASRKERLMPAKKKVTKKTKKAK
jgi:hypothetical protein